MMTLGSLFDGAGGFPLAGTMAGITPLWASEIEPFPIRVTTRRFPNMKHLGSITAINGGEIEPVDIVTFGSPCQDLSVAGRRRGLSGERSGLFLEAIRIIKEMREKTHGRKPRYIVWENVPGAFSSNAGRDFQAVLTEIIRIAEPNAPDVPLPDKRWPMADLYGGNGWSLAYRVYDAQFWGVPQRRKRIYLVGDFGGQRAGEILFKSESLLGYHTKSKGERAEVAGESTDSLRAENSGTGGEIIGLDFAHADSVVRTFEDKTPTLLQNMGSAGGQIPCVMHERRTVAGFTYNQGGEGKGLGFEEEKAPTIMTGGRGAVFMEKKSVIPLRDEVTRNKASNGLGVGEVGGPCPTLTTADVHSVFYEAYQHHGYRESSTSGTLTADQNSTIRGDTPLVCKEVKYYEGQQFGNYKESDVAGTVLAGQAKIVNNGTGIIVEKNRKAFELNQHGGYRETDASGTLRAAGGGFRRRVGNNHNREPQDKGEYP